MTTAELIQFLRISVNVQTSSESVTDPYLLKMTDEQMELFLKVVVTRDFPMYSLDTLPQSAIYPVILLSKKELYFALASVNAPLYDLNADTNNSLKRSQRFEHYMAMIKAVDDEYDQYALLDFIEFFAQNIKDISERCNNERYRNYQTIDCLNTSDIFNDFQEAINGIFAEAGLLYELTHEKIIERIVENSPLTSEIENNFAAVNEIGTRELLKDAVALYKTPNPAARQDSVEKIWDALERLKTYYITLDKRRSSEKIVNDMAGGNSDYVDLFNEEFKMLTSIGNKYRIRHHETDKIDITDVRYYDYLFNRCLSLIALAIKYLQ